MSPALFAAVDAVLSDAMDAALRSDAPHEEWCSTIWVRSQRLGWWRSCWPV